MCESDLASEWNGKWGPNNICKSHRLAVLVRWVPYTPNIDTDLPNVSSVRSGALHFLFMPQSQCLGLCLTHSRNSTNICSISSFLSITTAGGVLQPPPSDWRNSIPSLISDIKLMPSIFWDQINVYYSHRWGVWDKGQEDSFARRRVLEIWGAANAWVFIKERLYKKEVPTPSEI